MNRTDRAAETLDALRGAIPRPQTELHYTTPYELIVAVILSAQCTDARVNMITPPLTDAYPGFEALASAAPEEVYPFIKSCTYPNNKSKHLVNMARQVMEDFDGVLPETQKDLMKLAGVGRKTAQVVLSVAFEVDALPVDTHVFRVANRIGLVKSDADTPHKVERQLKRIIPRDEWGEAHHLLILHGRYTCTARSPKCEPCPVSPVCRYYERLQKLPETRTDLDAKSGAFYCGTERRYFDEPARRSDRYGVEQVACPSCGSMKVFDTKSGNTTKKVKDYRVG